MAITQSRIEPVKSLRGQRKPEPVYLSRRFSGRRDSRDSRFHFGVWE
jgi:hypothetical protein